MAQGNPYARFVEVMKRQGGGKKKAPPAGGIGKRGGSGRNFCVGGAGAERIFFHQGKKSKQHEGGAGIVGEEGNVSPSPHVGL